MSLKSVVDTVEFLFIHLFFAGSLGILDFFSNGYRQEPFRLKIHEHCGPGC